MSDLEHISKSIPAVFDAASHAAEEAERATLAARIRAIPHGPIPGDPGITEWTEPPHLRAWPASTISRLWQIREAIQALHIDAALDEIGQLTAEFAAIDHAAERRP